MSQPEKVANAHRVKHQRRFASIPLAFVGLALVFFGMTSAALPVDVLAKGETPHKKPRLTQVSASLDKYRAALKLK